MDTKNLLTQLKFGHQAIIFSLDDLQQVVRSYNQAKPKLRALQNTLLDHFSLMKNDLYDFLRAQLQNDSQALKTIEFLDFDIKDIKIKTLVFFDEFPADMGDVHPVNFPKKFSDYTHELAAHLRTERQKLFPLLERL